MREYFFGRKFIIADIAIAPPATPTCGAQGRI